MQKSLFIDESPTFAKVLDRLLLTIKKKSMTKNELIAKQQLEIEDYKVQLIGNKKIKREIRNKFLSIGKPLNADILHFNKDQLEWCFQVLDLVEQLNSL